MKKYLIFVTFVISSLACTFLTNIVASPTNTPIPTPTALPTITATFTVGLIEENIYCSSEIQDALDAYNIGYNDEQMGNYEQAIENYKHAIELDPKYCDAMDNLALNLKRVGKVDEAIDWYLRSIEILPTNDVAYLGLANAYRQQEQYDKATDAYKKMIGIVPENPEGYFGLGMVYFSTSHYQDSIDNLEEAERLYKEQNSSFVSDAQMFIGYDYFSLNDMENAVNYFEQAYPSYYDDATLNYYLGVAYYTESPVKDLAKAKKYLTTARDLGYGLDSELEKFISQP
ncbi:MAG: tetratricopeptide repeat protein [Anaerolineales bacterium]